MMGQLLPSRSFLDEDECGGGSGQPAFLGWMDGVGEGAVWE